MYDSQYDFRVAVEDSALKLNESLSSGPYPLAFSFGMPEDVTSKATGEMFANDADCIIVEVEIDREYPNVSQHAFKVVEGAISCYFCTKGTQPSRKYWRNAEQLARWFAHRTMDGAYFRGITLGQEVRHRGFRVFPVEVPFEFRLKLY